MRLHSSFCLGAVLAVSAFFPRPVAADVRLPALFADNAVLQRDIPVPVWGWADKDEQVTVKIGDQTKTATPDAATGKWTVKLDPLPAGGPYTLTVSGKNTLTLKNVLVGEVWLCSGQSNMSLPVRVGSINDAEEEIAAANYPKIRWITAPPGRNGNCPGSAIPLDDFKAQWEECSPKTVGRAFATAYFFGRELHKNLNVPIGLIQCAFISTTCQAWMKHSALEANPLFKPLLGYNDSFVNDYVSGVSQARMMEAWKKDVEQAKASNKPLPPEPHASDPREDTQMVSSLYNSMLHPTVPYGIRGVIWYQGENNTMVGRSFHYRTLFPTLIKSWRDEWQEGDFPFYFVQLATWPPVAPDPVESPLAEIREAQLMTLKVPNTGMAVSIDISEHEEIHPKNKQDVGKRLALWALAKTYGKNVDYCGPLYKSFEVRDDKVVISFDYVCGGLVAKGGEKLKVFAIAGADKKFVWADARIEGDKVVVSSPQVKAPVAVRYGWSDDPVEHPNLYNKAGLPASPFRTDDWPGLLHE